MPVEVAATRGDRFKTDGTPDPDYREARTTITLGKAESPRGRHRAVRSSPIGSSSIPMRRSCN